MSFTMWTLGVPLCLGVVGVALVFALHPNQEPGAALLVLAFFWLMFTSKMRRQYWSARIRSKGSYDERRARARAAK